MSQKLKFEIFSRLHLTLIGMNNNGYRINGGIGFAINHPNLNITISESKNFSIKDSRTHSLSSNEIEKIKTVLQTIAFKKKFPIRVKAQINGQTPTHYGFGTGTSIRLALIEGMFILNGLHYENQEIVKLSGRGKTSGIGIRTYFDGGYVIDLGHSNSKEKLLPSSKREHIQSESLLLRKGQIPDWELGICIPMNIDSTTQKKEKLFFEKTVPIKNESVNEILYHATYGILSSMVEDNIDVFNEACSKIQITEWKSKERDMYGSSLRQLEKDLTEFGSNMVGMTSMGPSLFFTSNNLDVVIEQMKKRCTTNISIFKVKTFNEGRKLICLN